MELCHYNNKYNLNIYQNRQHCYLSISKMKACICMGFHYCWTSHLGLRSTASVKLTVTCLNLDSVQSGGELVIDSEDVAVLHLFRLGFFREDSLCGLSTGQRLQRPHQLSLRDIRLLLDLLSTAENNRDMWENTAMPFNSMYRVINKYYEWRPVQLMPILEPVPLLNCLYE